MPLRHNKDYVGEDSRVGRVTRFGIIKVVATLIPFLASLETPQVSLRSNQVWISNYVRDPN